MARYASKTTVPSGQSLREIERTLDRYGAESFAYGKSATQIMVQFVFSGQPFQIVVPMPDPMSDEFCYTDAGRDRADDARRKLVEQAGRQRLRALSLFIKATCEAVDLEILTFEAAFLSSVMIGDGVTVGDRLLPEIKLIQESGKLPKLLPGG